MENYETITVRGLSGETAVLNPAFDWTAVKTDAKYKVTVTDATGRVADEGEVTTPHYELTARLDYDKTYTVVAVGQDSKTGYKATFKTAAGSSAPNIATAEITLAEPNKSHMVLQRGKEIKIGGKTTANLLLTMDFFGAHYYATSDEGGNFTFIIPAQAANKTPGNIEIRLLKNKKVTLEDVLIGDVFLVSGQSNVQRTLTECSKPGETPEWAGDVEDARAADVRYYYQAENALSAPSDSTKNAFWGLSPQTERTISSIPQLRLWWVPWSARSLPRTGSPSASSMPPKAIPASRIGWAPKARIINTITA